MPKHHKQWTKSAKALCLSRASINTKDGLKPGSEVVQGQHLLYKVYWPRLIARARVDVRKMGFENEFRAASEWMSEYGPFQAYLTSLEAGSAITAHSDYDDHDLGIFEVARSQQLQLLHADGAREDTIIVETPKDQVPTCRYPWLPIEKPSGRFTSQRDRHI